MCINAEKRVEKRLSRNEETEKYGFIPVKFETGENENLIRNTELNCQKRLSEENMVQINASTGLTTIVIQFLRCLVGEMKNAGLTEIQLGDIHLKLVDNYIEIKRVQG
jgi:hypothetical protein